MKCKYSLKINGKTVTLLSDVPENIKDINDLERLLKNPTLKQLGFMDFGKMITSLENQTSQRLRISDRYLTKSPKLILMLSASILHV